MQNPGCKIRSLYMCRYFEKTEIAVDCTRCHRNSCHVGYARVMPSFSLELFSISHMPQSEVNGKVAQYYLHAWDLP